MSGAEARWRASSALRASMDRACTAVRPPAWNSRDIIDVLGGMADEDALRRAARTGDWNTAHAVLSNAVTTQKPAFVIAPTMRSELSRQVLRAFPDSASDAAARADRIVSGQYDLLGYRSLRFDRGGSPGPDWHLDPVHGRRAPLLFWSAVPYLDPACGDHKIIWELNRHQHLLVLGRAYWLTGDARYSGTACAQLRNWLDANPPLMGINWASMLELGFRVLSWVWAVNLFAGDRQNEGDPWLVDLFVALDRQLAHIERNLSYYFSPNTHLLGEALALYVAGQALPMLRRGGRYVATGRRILTEQMERQIAQDGGHLERSTHYHRYTLDFYVLALAVARITRDPIATTFEHAVSRLAGAARLLADDHGRLPHIGDDDGGMLLPICGRAPDDITDSLAVAAALVDRPNLRVGSAPEEAFWLLGQPLFESAVRHMHAPASQDAPRSAALPDTGYYVSRCEDSHHLVVDAGPHGYENGGHAHADSLSLTLTVQGLPLLIDPGTGSYTSDSAARDSFRSSRLHNTLVIDGRSQSEPSGPFHWSRTATGAAHIWRTNRAFDYLEASHDGYSPLTHRRCVFVLHHDLLIVADMVDGTGTHEAEVHWHLDPRWSVQTGERRALLLAGGKRAEFATSGGTLECVSGTTDRTVGWHAPLYGRIEPTSTLRVAASGSAPMWIVSVFGLDTANELFDAEQVAVVTDRPEAFERTVAVRVTRARSTDFFGVAAMREVEAGHEHRGARLPWRLAGFETDARMLFCRTAGAVSRLALVDGSLVRSEGPPRLQVQLHRQVPDFYNTFEVARPCVA
jgi:uncharacterized heparinase superfamily protein